MTLLVATSCAPRPAEDPDAGFTAPPARAPDIPTMIAHFKATGLPIGRVDIYTAETDPFKRLGRPGEYAGKAIFHDTRFPLPPNDFVQWPQWGGTIETFASAADMQSWKRRIRQAREAVPAAPPEYQYEKGLALVRLGGVLTPDQAKGYEAAVASFPG